MLAKSASPSIRESYKELQDEASLLGDELASLEQQYKRSSALKNSLGRAFGFGPAGKLEWVRFKLRYKQGQLAEFESQNFGKAA